ncbi:MAG: ABC transporter ATP-binding protein [Deltaproteobacteria bacterium]|nr:ABC transporter ATP-binding protein [Candidatus Tharpella sp.]
MGVKFKDLSFNYGSQPVLEKISCSLTTGRIYAVLGVNGAGKSTLIKLLAGFLKPVGGSIFLDDDNLDELSLSQIAKRVAYVPQYQQLSDLTVSDYLLLGRKPHWRWLNSSTDEEIVFTTLEKLHLNNLALRPLYKLSGGELQKTAIARALVQEPEILLLDEPTSSLDLKNQHEVMEIIVRETTTRNLTTIITLHDVNLALRFAESFLLMKEKKILAFGGREIMTQKNLSELYEIKVQLNAFGKSVLVAPE